jgi:hypothetical protein
MRASEETVRQRLDDLIAGFDEYASRFDSAVSVDDDRQFGSHRRTIQRRRELGSIEAAIEDEAFVELLYRTIQQWGIGRRGSRIVPLPTFHASLLAHRSALLDLDRLSIESDAFEVASIGAALDDLVANLSIVENRARIVAATKTLHHLLPDLVPPMDRAWTGAFFGWTSSDPQHNQTQIFERSFVGLAEVARTAKPGRLVGDGWRTCSTKILDNALIGYCKSIGIGG